MIKIEHSVVINRPIEEIFAFMDNPKNDPKWQSGVLESEQTSEGPAGVGATFREVRKFMGRRFESTLELTKHEPNKNIAWKTTSGPIPFELTATFESVEGGTKIAIVGEVEPGGFFKLAESVVERMLTRQVEADFGNLKDLLES